MEELNARKKRMLNEAIKQRFIFSLLCLSSWTRILMS